MMYNLSIELIMIAVKNFYSWLIKCLRGKQISIKSRAWDQETEIDRRAWEEEL